jgi:hypothetical protein
MTCPFSVRDINHTNCTLFHFQGPSLDLKSDPDSRCCRFHFSKSHRHIDVWRRLVIGLKNNRTLKISFHFVRQLRLLNREDGGTRLSETYVTKERYDPNRRKWISFCEVWSVTLWHLANAGISIKYIKSYSRSAAAATIASEGVVWRIKFIAVAFSPNMAVL